MGREGDDSLIGRRAVGAQYDLPENFALLPQTAGRGLGEWAEASAAAVGRDRRSSQATGGTYETRPAR